MVKTLIVAAALLAGAFVARSQPVDTRQGIFDDDFRTLKVERVGDPLGLPVVSLDVPDSRVAISFDELAEDASRLRYELVHCDRQWRPSRIVESEWLDGFNEAEVDDWAFSRATLVHYVNYRVELPNERMAPRVSGNYLVRFFREGDPDNIIAQARFMVTEQTLGLRADVTSRTDVDYNASHQQLTVEVDTKGSDVDNPYTDLTVVIVQNGRPDNAVTLTTPLRVSGTTAVYDHQRPLIFDAGNEYRRFETVSTVYLPMGVESVVRPSGEGDPYQFLLLPDSPRAADRYRYDQTQNGRFFVREYNSVRSDTEADYALVRFTLEGPWRGDVYLDGDFTQRRLDGSSRMVWNQLAGVYEGWQLLKQGAYNYQYLVPSASALEGGATGPVEGNFHETVNEYSIYVYYTPRMGRYDRLGAVTRIFSGR